METAYCCVNASVDMTGAGSQVASRRVAGGDRVHESRIVCTRRSISPTQVTASCQIQRCAPPNAHSELPFPASGVKTDARYAARLGMRWTRSRR
jgi:hypothetical protein